MRKECVRPTRRDWLHFATAALKAVGPLVPLLAHWLQHYFV
jgi:hypothetical protein